MQESRKAPIPKYNEVGSRIRELRVSHALSQKAFAQTLNMSQGHLSRVEKGAVISVALCALIAEKFNSTKEYLLFGVKEKPLGVTTSSVPVIPNPDTEFSGFSLDQTDSLVRSNKQVKRILEQCKYEYTFVVDEIRDVDSILDTDEQLYPATSYTFAISVRCLPSGYQWEAREVKRSEANLEGLQDTYDETERKKQMEGQGRKYTPRKTAKDTCSFEPYAFELYSSYDFIETEYGRIGDIARYREAKALALYKGLECPEDCYDPILDELAPDKNVYFSDGTVDRDAEFERFKKVIRSGVGGKSLRPSPVRALEGEYFTSGGGVVYKGRRYSLGFMGRIGITVEPHEYGESEVQFIIDDKRLSAAQFIDMLSSYDGWQLSFTIDSD